MQLGGRVPKGAIGCGGPRLCKRQLSWLHTTAAAPAEPHPQPGRICAAAACNCQCAVPGTARVWRLSTSLHEGAGHTTHGQSSAPHTSFFSNACRMHECVSVCALRRFYFLLLSSQSDPNMQKLMTTMADPEYKAKVCAAQQQITAQHSMAQHGTPQHGAARHGRFTQHGDLVTKPTRERRMHALNICQRNHRRSTHALPHTLPTLWFPAFFRTHPHAYLSLPYACMLCLPTCSHTPTYLYRLRVP